MSFQGTVLEEYRYDAFGKWTLWNEPTGSYNNRFYFTGREWTGSALGFYEYRNRAYHPGIGRFMSEDPKGFDGGDYNLYRYCGNDPLDHTDPMGTEQIDDHNQSAGHDGVGGAYGPGVADRLEQMPLNRIEQSEKAFSGIRGELALRHQQQLDTFSRYIREGWHFNIKATIFGGKGEKTDKSPYGIPLDRDDVAGVALPVKGLKGYAVEILNHANGYHAIAPVADVGGHFTNDNEYVHGFQRPKAEKFTKNKEGLDMLPQTARDLGIRYNLPYLGAGYRPSQPVVVDWRLISPGGWP